MSKKLTIPAPKFEQYQFVTLHWNGQDLKTKIVSRIYNLDEEIWSYGVSGSSGLYWSQSLSARED